MRVCNSFVDGAGLQTPTRIIAQRFIRVRASASTSPQGRTASGFATLSASRRSSSALWQSGSGAACTSWTTLSQIASATWSRSSILRRSIPRCCSETLAMCASKAKRCAIGREYTCVHFVRQACRTSLRGRPSIQSHLSETLHSLAHRWRHSAGVLCSQRDTLPAQAQTAPVRSGTAVAEAVAQCGLKEQTCPLEGRSLAATTSYRPPSTSARQRAGRQPERMADSHHHSMR